MIRRFGYLFVFLPLLGVLPSHAQSKRGTITVEPEITQIMTMIGPVFTERITALQLCDSLSTVQCNDESVTVISYEISIEMRRDLRWKVTGNKLPAELCGLGQRLRPNDMIYVEDIWGLDAYGKKVKLPPCRVMITEPNQKRPAFDTDEADGLVPHNE